MKVTKNRNLKKIEVLSEQDEFSLIQVLNRKYAVYLNGRFFRFKVITDTEAAYLTVTLLSRDEKFFYPVEARIAHRDQGIEPKEAVFLTLDYIDIYFDEYFKGQENTYLPVDWTAYSFEGSELELKAQVRNKRAEDLADQIIQGNIKPDDIQL